MTIDYKKELFEECAFNDYFVKGISFGNGPFASQNNNLTMKELLDRDGDDYVREEISAMWNGWKLAIKALL